jgi:hypothetical protein
MNFHPTAFLFSVYGFNWISLHVLGIYREGDARSLNCENSHRKSVQRATGESDESTNNDEALTTDYLFLFGR